MKIKEFYYDSDNNNYLVFAKAWIPDKKPRAIIQIIHGMTEHTGRYEEAAKFFNERDIMVVMNDHLGHGKTAANTRGFFGYNNGISHLVEDVKKLMRKTQRDYPDIPYFMLGVSMGSFLERLILAQRDVTKNLSGAIIAATSVADENTKHLYKLSQDLVKKEGPKRSNASFAQEAFSDINNAFQNENDDLSWITSNVGRREKYRNDSKSNFIFTNAGYRDLFKLLLEASDPEIIKATDNRLPLLFISGKDDPIGGFGNSIRQLACQYLSKGTDDLTAKIYPKVRHEVLFDFPATQNLSLPFIYNWIAGHLNNYRNFR